MKRRFLERLEEVEHLLGDGAMGTMLQAAGLPTRHAPEEWNLSQPEKVLAVYRGYIAAGSEMIETNSFGANRFRLAKYGLEEKVYELNFEAARLARKAAGEALVAGSVGPTGEYFPPLGSLTFEEAKAAFAQQAQGLADGDADLLFIETMADLKEVEAALKGVREATDLPAICTMTFSHRLHTVMGVSPKEAAETLYSWGVEALGANCGLGPQDTEKVMEEMRDAAPEAVLAAQPNAGIPRLVGGSTQWDATPELMVEYALRYARLGVKIIGACCGSTPEHIAAMAQALGKKR